MMSFVTTRSNRAIHFGAAFLLVAFASLLNQEGASAASLDRVDNWGASGVPETVSMYLYVPDQIASPAPVLVLAHYCGGTAPAVFGQATGGGLVAAADEYGFIMVVPQAANPDGTGRCWDVGSQAALMREGGGDTEAIVQMVKYALQEFDANADRVYVAGTSSGGMMTQALLALYPDVFKAGSALAGVPAGCWAVNNPGGGWSGPCAGGTVTHSPAEWGDIARALAPGYTGYRPRVQLFHGDADDIILFQNHLEAIKQWSNVLNLDEAPTSSETLTLGNHESTRQRWLDDCGYVALDAFTSLGGDHGPSDALFLAEHLVPFFGLDDAGAQDPQVAACPGMGTGGAGGMGTGGAGGMGTGGAGGMGTGGETGNPSGAGGSSAPGSTGGQTTGGGEMTESPVDSGATTSAGACSITGESRSTFSPWWLFPVLLLVRQRSSPRTRRLKHAAHEALMRRF